MLVELSEKHHLRKEARCVCRYEKDLKQRERQRIAQSMRRQLAFYRFMCRNISFEYVAEGVRRYILIDFLSFVTVKTGSLPVRMRYLSKQR